MLSPQLAWSARDSLAHVSTYLCGIRSSVVRKADSDASLVPNLDYAILWISAEHAQALTALQRRCREGLYELLRTVDDTDGA